MMNSREILPTEEDTEDEDKNSTITVETGDRKQSNELTVDPPEPKIKALLNVIETAFRMSNAAMSSEDDWNQWTTQFTNISKLREINNWKSSVDGWTTFKRLSDKQKRELLYMYRNMQRYSRSTREKISKKMLSLGVPIPSVHYYIEFLTKINSSKTSKGPINTAIDRDSCVLSPEKKSSTSSSENFSFCQDDPKPETFDLVNDVGEDLSNSVKCEEDGRQQIDPYIVSFEVIKYCDVGVDASPHSTLSDPGLVPEVMQYSTRPQMTDSSTQWKHDELTENVLDNISITERSLIFEDYPKTLDGHQDFLISNPNCATILENVIMEDLLPIVQLESKELDHEVAESSQSSSAVAIMSSKIVTCRRSGLGASLPWMNESETIKSTSYPTELNCENSQKSQPMNSVKEFSEETTSYPLEYHDFFNVEDQRLVKEGIHEFCGIETQRENVDQRVVKNVMTGELTEMTPEDVDYTPDRIFSLIIPAEDVPTFFDFTTKTFVKYNWSVVVRKHMMLSLHNCQPTAKKSPFMPLEHNRHLYFCKMSMVCKCSVNFFFAGFHDPQVGHDYVLHGHASGEFKLEQRQKNFPGIRGHMRKMFQRELEHESSLKVYRRFIFTLPEEYRLHIGPLDNVLPCFRQLKSEVVRSARKHPNILEDLKRVALDMEEKYYHKEIPGFVHQINEISSKFHLYTAQQLRLAAALNSKKRLEGKYFWDMTGSIVGKLEKYERKPLYGALIFKAKELKDFVVAEMISAVNKAVDLTEFFSRVLIGMRTCSGNSKLQPSLIIMDNSDASISAILRSWNMQDLPSYVDLCYSIFNDPESMFPSNKTPILLCVGHLNKSFLNNISRKISKSDKAHQIQREIAQYALARLIEVETKLEFEKVIAASVTVLGLKTIPDEDIVIQNILYLKTDRAVALLEFLNNRDVDQEIVEPEDCVLDCDSTNDPQTKTKSIKSQSGFYIRFQEIRNSVEKQNSDVTTKVNSENHENAYFNLSMLDVLQNYVAKFPLWNLTVIRTKMGFEDLEQMTTGTVEAHFKNEKRKLHPERPIRAGKFVETHEVCIMGVVKQEQARAITKGFLRKNFMVKAANESTKENSDSEKEFHEQQEEWGEGKLSNLLLEAKKKKVESKRLTEKAHLRIVREYFSKKNKNDVGMKTGQVVNRKRQPKQLLESRQGQILDEGSEPKNIKRDTTSGSKKLQKRLPSQAQDELEFTNEATDLPWLNSETVIVPSYNAHAVDGNLTIDRIKSLATKAGGKGAWLGATVIDHLNNSFLKNYEKSEIGQNVALLPYSTCYLAMLGVQKGVFKSQWLPAPEIRLTTIPIQNITEKTQFVYHNLAVIDHFVLIKLNLTAKNFTVQVFDSMENYRASEVAFGVKLLTEVIGERLVQVDPFKFKDIRWTRLPNQRVPGGNGWDCGPGVVWTLSKELEASCGNVDYQDIDLRSFRGKLLVRLLQSSSVGRVIVDYFHEDILKIRKFILTHNLMKKTS